MLQEYLDLFCTAYLDNILIYSKNKNNYKKHVRKVVGKLINASLFIDINKCYFKVKRVKYLELILTTKGIKMDLTKV
jgi:hypothetical protein